MELLPSWYAVYTTSRSEKKVKARLDEAKVDNYLPLRTEYRMWSDRKKKVSFPLIPRLYFRPYPDSGHLKSFKYTRNCHLSQRKSGPRPYPG